MGLTYSYPQFPLHHSQRSSAAAQASKRQEVEAALRPGPGDGHGITSQNAVDAEATKPTQIPGEGTDTPPTAPGRRRFGEFVAIFTPAQGGSEVCTRY